MERDAQIRQTAAEWLSCYHPICTQDMLVEAFRCGAQWADSHPASPWVNAKERLPEEGQLVFLVRIKDGYNSGCLGFYKGKKEEGYVFGNDQGEFIVKDGDFIVWKEEPKTFDI